MRILSYISAVLFLAACSDDANETKPDVEHGYYFFPKANIYYDTADKEFIYFDSATRQWQQGNLPPTYIQGDMGKSVLLDTAPAPVWSANPEHRLVYSARLYADSSDFKKPPPVQKETVLASEPSADEEEQPRKRSRVGKFFDRVFGKKKD